METKLSECQRHVKRNFPVTVDERIFFVTTLIGIDKRRSQDYARLDAINEPCV